MVFWTSVGYSNKPHSPAFAPPRARPGLLSFALWRQRAPKLILTPKDETCLTRPQPSPLRSSSLHGKSGAQDKSGWKCSSGEGVRGASRYPHPAWGGPDRQTDRQGTARFSFRDRRAAASPSPSPAWHSARLARRQTGSPRHPILPRSRWQFHRPTDFNFCKKRQQAPLPPSPKKNPPGEGDAPLLQNAQAQCTAHAHFSPRHRSRDLKWLGGGLVRSVFD